MGGAPGVVGGGGGGGGSRSGGGGAPSEQVGDGRGGVSKGGGVVEEGHPPGGVIAEMTWEDGLRALSRYEALSYWCMRP